MIQSNTVSESNTWEDAVNGRIINGQLYKVVTPCKFRGCPRTANGLVNIVAKHP
jgi:hypothetical protein